MTVVATITGSAATQTAIAARNDAIVASVRKAVASLTMRLLTHVKQDKLSGQVLNVRTGRLRRSITSELNEKDGQITGLVGTNVVYAPPFEMGFTGDEQVREHMRKATMAFGKMIKNPRATLVRAHVRHVNIPERSFLRSALADMAPQIQAELAVAVESPSATPA